MAPIFVFGSNLAGRHGAGAAKWALENRGAIYGMGSGLQGQSYAIPTKGYDLEVLPLARIKLYVDCFLAFAGRSPNTEFAITHIGCGLAGYDWEKDIRPLFPAVLPKNCFFI